MSCQTQATRRHRPVLSQRSQFSNFREPIVPESIDMPMTDEVVVKDLCVLGALGQSTSRDAGPTPTTNHGMNPNTRCAYFVRNVGATLAQLTIERGIVRPEPL